MEYKERRKRLWQAVQGKGLDAFLLLNEEGSEQPNLRYLTGFTGTFGVLILSEEALFLTDSRYTEQARKEAPDLAVEEVKGKWMDALVGRLKAMGLGKVGIGTYRTSLHLFQELAKRGQGLELQPLDGVVEELREVKSAEEIARIRGAAELTDAGLEQILKDLRPGRTEREVALALEFWYRNEGAEDVAFELIVSGGPMSAMPHHRAANNKLKVGEVVLFDIGARLDGYCADLTRVVALGKVGQKVRETYDLVLAANRAGIEALAERRSGREVDARAREVIEKAGLGERFGHGLGHGVGMEVHEAPRLAPTSDDVLLPGMVTTVEPGVYFPGEFGIRIEDLVALTPQGPQVLSTFPKDELLVI